MNEKVFLNRHFPEKIFLNNIEQHVYTLHSERT